MSKQCLECSTEIIDIQEIYIKGKEVCPYCFNILNIPIIENVFSMDLIDNILSKNIVKHLVSDFDSEKHINISMILLVFFLMIGASILPLIIRLFI